MVKVMGDRLALDGGEPVRREALPLHRPAFDEAEVQAAAEVIRSGHVAGNGPVSRDLERMFREYLGVRHALLTTSGTAALELALRACFESDSGSINGQVGC